MSPDPSQPGSDPADHADVVALPPVIFGVAVLLGVAAQWVLGGEIAPESGARVAAGWLLLGVGVAGMVGFGRAFKRAGQDPNPRTATPGIVTEGLYRYSRNPAYVCFTAIHIGLGLLLDNPWILLALVPVLVLMHTGVILREEAYLERKFGDEYLRYKARVRRWI